MKPNLTRRERQCLLAVWEAGSQDAAAIAIGINRETLRTHLQTARAKLGVHTTLAAIRRVVVG
jgi:DNA-binding CsgD family transcriptional regulator